jgi:hypothetical protein
VGQRRVTEKVADRKRTVRHDFGHQRCCPFVCTATTVTVAALTLPPLLPYGHCHWALLLHVSALWLASAGLEDRTQRSWVPRPCAWCWAFCMHQWWWEFQGSYRIVPGFPRSHPSDGRISWVPCELWAELPSFEGRTFCPLEVLWRHDLSRLDFCPRKTRVCAEPHV